MRRLIPLTFLCILAGCASLPSIGEPRTSMELIFDKDAMQAEVLKYLSPGMPIENAKRIMEDSGFKCENSLSMGPPAVSCVHASHHFLMIDEIQVLLYHEAGKLTKIEVDCGTIGP